MQCFESLPVQFLERLGQLIPDHDKRQTVLETFCHKKPIAIRVNTLIGNVETLLEEFTTQSITYKQVVWYQDAYIIENSSTEQLTQLENYRQGHFYIQNLSSMIPPLIIDPQPRETILDMCAAPGSKTSQLAVLMNNTGKIIANDKSRQRIYKLQSNLKSQHVTNTEVTSFPGEILWRKFPNHFDKVLVDAPCSMEGRFNANDPETYTDWSLKKIKLLSQSQKWLLRSAITATKPGGTVVYSTCTLSPEENEGVIDWLLKNESYPIQIEKITIPNLQHNQPIRQWKNKIYDESIANCLRILPTDEMEGFFVAKIRKMPL